MRASRGDPAWSPGALTEEYLSPAQRATASPGWFEAAIAWACRPVRASIAPLAPSARRIGELDGYEVSDILVHHGTERYAGQQRVPVTPWDVLAEHSEPGRMRDGRPARHVLRPERLRGPRIEAGRGGRAHRGHDLARNGIPRRR